MYKRWHVEWRLSRKVWFVSSMHSTRLQARIAANKRKKDFPAFTVRIRDTFMRMHKTLQRAREASKKHYAKRNLEPPPKRRKENVP